jgi:hypothetical protein
VVFEGGGPTDLVDDMLDYARTAQRDGEDVMEVNA